MGEMKCGLHNEFDIIVRNAETGEIKNQGKAYNIILNQFWTRYLSANNNSVFNNIHFGSGAASPAATDTGMTTWVGYKASIKTYDYSTFDTDKTIKIKATCRLEASEYIGATISELGFGYSTSNGTAVTKALVKDQNGNPLSIVKGASDVIDIFATFYVTISNSSGFNFKLRGDTAAITDGLMSFILASWSNIANVGYGYAAMAYFNEDFFAGFSAAGLKYDVGNGSLSYDTANKKVTVSFPNIGTSVGNIGGFESFVAVNVAAKVPAANFAQPVLTKEVVGTGDGTNKDFSCSFGRIKNNGTAKLFVNDVEANATFDYGLPGKHDDIGMYMNVISGKVGPSSEERQLPVIMENPYYQKFGITGARGGYFALYASTDMASWTKVAERASSTNTAAVDPTYKNYRYWKLEPYGASFVFEKIISSEMLSNLVIHAETAPASGATVALTYQPDRVAKDSDHIINSISLSVTFNEYTP